MGPPPEPVLNEQQQSDQRFKVFSLITAVNSILATSKVDASPLNDPALDNAIDFLQRHTGGVLYGLAKQIFPQNNNDNA